MTTQAASGWSAKRETTEAVRDALGRALSTLRTRQISFALLFVGPGHDPEAALGLAISELGTNCVLLSSTAGEFTESGWSHEGVAALVVASNSVDVVAGFSRGIKLDPASAAERLCESVPALKRQSKIARPYLTSVLLTDGLAGTGETLVKRMAESLRSFPHIVGGAAADEGRFVATRVGAGSEFGTQAAAVLHVLGRTPWGIGVEHGLRATTKPMRVTKAKHNVVYEIDGAPAFRAYEKHASERGIRLTPQDASAYLIENELGIQFFEKVVRARAPLAVDANGALTCAAEVPEGSIVTILDGEPANMIEAAKTAAQTAKAQLGGVKAAAVLLFDCVCRGMILKDEFQKEIDTVRSVFGAVPIAGFLTYGEIARHAGQLDGWNNTTAVVAAIPAD